MKTLHLSIIVLIIGISFAVSNNAYGCNFCPMIPSPLPYVPTSITVNTNLENYTTTDKMIITTHVTNPDNTLLWIKIFAPNKDLESYHTFPPSSNESYTWVISPIEFYNSGNYTVTAQYGQDYAVTHFHLNSTLIQYYQSQSPLKQYKMADAQDVHCHTGLQLVLKAEDYSPVCLKPETATKLIQRGWALDTTSPVPFIKKMWITGLQQNYTVGQPINATVNYVGYYWYAEPEVKILDANGTQVWFNCPYCYVRSEAIPSPSLGTFTYHVREYASNNPPVINKTGTYTMIASLENQTASAEFTIVKQLLLPVSFMPCDTPYLQSNTGVSVLYMPMNSIGKICVRYSNPNDTPVPVGIRIFEANNLNHDATEISTWNDLGNNTTITKGNSTVVYWINTGNQPGFYGLTIFCVGMPFSVGYDNNSTMVSSDFPWLGKTFACPLQSYQFHIDSLTGIGVKYIPYP